jgi:putative membrane protein
MHYFGFNGIGTLGGFGMIIIWLIIIAIIVIVVRMFVGSNKSNADKSKNAMDILKERYAAGEISREEFEEKKHDLAQS